MKIKVLIAVVTILLVVSITSYAYYKSNYKTLDEAISEANVSMNEIFHMTEYKGNTIIFYGVDDQLSVGLLEDTLLGYRWSHAVGSKHFNIENQLLTRSFSNLHPRDWKSDDELVSLTHGVIYDDAIEHVRIIYKDSSMEATIINTSKGRIWYGFSTTTLNYDPEVIRIYEDAAEVSGWY